MYIKLVKFKKIIKFCYTYSQLSLFGEITLVLFILSLLRNLPKCLRKSSKPGVQSEMAAWLAHVVVWWRFMVYSCCSMVEVYGSLML